MHPNITTSATYSLVDIFNNNIDIFTSSGRLSSVGGLRLKDLTNKIKQLDQEGRVFIRDHHIEKERIYREIQRAHVHRALLNGRATELRNSDSSLIWQGQDEDGRLLELICTLKNEEGEITVVVEDVRTVVVGTAYDPTERDDNALKARWLKEHPHYEDAGKRKGVQRKLMVTRK